VSSCCEISRAPRRRPARRLALGKGLALLHQIGGFWRPAGMDSPEVDARSIGAPWPLQPWLRKTGKGVLMRGERWPQTSSWKPVSPISQVIRLKRVLASCRRCPDRSADPVWDPGKRETAAPPIPKSALTITFLTIVGTCRYCMVAELHADASTLRVLAGEPRQIASCPASKAVKPPLQPESRSGCALRWAESPAVWSQLISRPGADSNPVATHPHNQVRDPVSALQPDAQCVTANRSARGRRQAACTDRCRLSRAR